jgi:hypothetical protein
LDLEPLDLDSAAPIEVPVKYKGKDYLLREADADTGVAYRDLVQQSYSYNPDGSLARLDGMNRCAILLVTGCLKEVLRDGSEVKLGRVSEGFVKALPDKALRKLFERAKEISGFNEGKSAAELRQEIAVLEKRLAALEEKGDPAKNGQPATAATSA